MTPITPQQREQIAAAEVGNVLKKVKAGKTLTAGERQLIDESTGAPRLGMASNYKAASVITGLPVAAIQAAKDSGCPAWKANGRIDCDALVTWMAEHQDVLAQFSDVPNIEVERALLVKARRLDLEQRTAQRGKTLVEIATVKREIGKMILSAKAQLMTNIDSIAAGAAMKLALTPEQVTDLRQIVSNHTLAALRELSKGEWK